MAKYKADHLKEMIRGVVREEVRALAVEMVREEMRTTAGAVIAEVLSEKFLRKIMSEGTVAPRGVATLEIQGDDAVEEEAPHALSNDILGVGQNNPFFKKDPSEKRVVQYEEEEEVDEAAIPDEFNSIFFEGTKPLPKMGASAEEGEGIPLDAFGMNEEAEPAPSPKPARRQQSAFKPAPVPTRTGSRKPINEVWTTLAGVDKKKDENAIDPAVRAQLEEARLKRLRESLDVKA